MTTENFTTPEPVDLEIQEGLDTLHRRGMKLKAWAKAALYIAAGGAAVAVIKWIMADYAVPVEHLQAIDIPGKLLDTFSDTVTTVYNGNNETNPFKSITTVSDSFINAFSWAKSPIAFAFGIGGVIAGGAGLVFGVDGFLSRMAAGIGAIIVSANIMGMFTETVSDSKVESYPSSREEFVTAAKDKDLATILQKLGGVRTIEADYVRAQVGLLDKSGKPYGALIQDVAARLDNKPDFKPSPEVAYLIDLVAYNQPKSEAARNYLKERRELHDSRIESAKFNAGLAALLSVIGIWLMGFAQSLIRRVKRIHSVMAGGNLSQWELKNGKHEPEVREWFPFLPGSKSDPGEAKKDTR